MPLAKWRHTHMQRSSYPLSPLFHFLQKNKSSSSSPLSSPSNAQLQSFRPNSSNLKQHEVHRRVRTIQTSVNSMTHRAASDWAPLVTIVVNARQHGALGGWAGMCDKLRYLQPPSARRVRMLGSGVRRSKVSGGWYAALGQRWGMRAS